MKRLLAIPLILVALTATAGERSVTFSRHSPKLKLVSFDERQSVGIFEGDLTTTGTLFFTFDLDAQQKVADLLFAKFVPDEPPLLPAVASGFYPGPVRYVSLGPAEEILVAAFGKDAMKRFIGTKEREVGVAVEVTFKRYNTSVECDSRLYYSKSVVVRPLQRQIAALATAPHGC